MTVKENLLEGPIGTVRRRNEDIVGLCRVLIDYTRSSLIIVCGVASREVIDGLRNYSLTM